MRYYQGVSMRFKPNPTATIMTLARRDARRAVEAWLSSQGQRPSAFALAEIKALAGDWVREHPEIVTQAAAKAVAWGLIEAYTDNGVKSGA
jgi:hypothetical protein